MPMDDDSIIDAPAYKSSNGLQLAYRSRHTDTSQKQADTPQRPHVVFCGGFHSSMLGTKAAALEQTCMTLGLSYTRFDYRGHGESEGEPASFTLAHWLEDTLCVLNDITGPIILVGSSMGGWLATLAALQKPNTLQGLLLIAAAPDFLQELVQPRLSQSDIWDLQQGQTLSLPNAHAAPYPLTQSLLDSGVELSLFNPTPAGSSNTVASITCPIRLVHGTADTDVPYELSVRLMSRFDNAEAQLTLMQGADHRLSDERCLEHINKTLIDLVNISNQ